MSDPNLESLSLIARLHVIPPGPDAYYPRVELDFVAAEELGETFWNVTVKPEWKHLDDLRVAAFQSEGKLICHDVAYYGIYSLDLERAETCLKTLRQVQKGLDRLQAQWGIAPDYATLCLRVCRVLGVSKFFRDDQFRRSGEVRLLDVIDLGYHLNTQLLELAERQKA